MTDQSPLQPRYPRRTHAIGADVPARLSPVERTRLQRWANASVLSCQKHIPLPEAKRIEFARFLVAGGRWADDV